MGVSALESAEAGRDLKFTSCWLEHVQIWENHGKTMRKPWENGDLYGKSQCFNV